MASRLKLTQWSVLKHKENSKTKCNCIEQCQPESYKLLENTSNMLISRDILTKTGKIVKLFNIIDIIDLEFLILSTPETERNFYEVIQTNKPRKLYFDIDINISDYPQSLYLEYEVDEFVAKLEYEIPGLLLGDLINKNNNRNKFKSVQYTSHSDKKLSYHIIFNVTSTSHHEMKAFVQYVKEKISQNEKLGKFAKHIDLSVYSGNRSFRLEKCAKYGQIRFKKRINGIFNNGLISYLENTQDVSSFMKKFVKEEPKKNILLNDQHTIEDKDIDEILNALSVERATNYDSWLKVGMALYNYYEESDIGLTKWNKFSSKANNYDPDSLDGKWFSFGKCDKPITIATLIMWACEDSEEYKKKKESNKPLTIFNLMDTIEQKENNIVNKKIKDVEQKENNIVNNKIENIELKEIKGVDFLYYILKQTPALVLSKNPLCLRNSISNWRKSIKQFGFKVPNKKSELYFKSRDDDFICGLLAATIAIILNGGKLFYVTKNFKDNEIYYEIIQKGGILNQPITYESKEFNKKTEQMQVKTKQMQIKKFLAKMIENSINVYDYYDFLPYSPKQPLINISNDKIFNAFTGFKAQNKQQSQKLTNEQIQEIIEPILFHIREIFANKNNEIYEYLIKWFATFFQKPQDKLTCLYMYSEKEGAGKTGFFNWFIDKIVGDQYCIMCDMNKILGKFNSALDRNLLCVFNETKDFGEGYTEDNKLKSIISDTKHVIENKGMDCRKVTNNSKIVITTNNINLVRIKKNDRRYCVLNLNNDYACNKEYFNKFYKTDLNQISTCAFYIYLINVNLNN